MAESRWTRDASLSPLHRVYLIAVGTFAIWVGIWGYFFPKSIDRAIPWLVPPLHARFLGAMYLSGTILLLGSLFVRRVGHVSIALVMASVWTGMLGIVSFLRLGEFDFDHKPVWFWFFAYVVYPIAGLWLWWQYRTQHEQTNGPHLPVVARTWMAIQAAVCVVLASLLLFVPTTMSERWPWTISPLLAQIYSGPFLSYGVGSLLVARHRSSDGIRVPLLSIAGFAAMVLTASVLHHDLFTLSSASAVLWFGGFSVALLFMVYAIGFLYAKQGSES